jgi:hypothetical protein
MDEDALGFSGAAFADAQFGAVKGRIARRRAARSAGVGGASVLGVGALAVGAAQVPWGGLVFGTPGSSVSVVCTTATPDAVAGVGVEVPDGAIFAVTDTASGTSYFVGARYADPGDAGSGVPMAWSLAGVQLPLTLDGDHIGTLALPSGATVEVNTLTGGVTPSDAGAVTITPVDDYVDQATPEPSAPTLVVFQAAGTSASFAPDSETSPDAVTQSSDGARAGVTWVIESEDGTVAGTAYLNGTTLVVDTPDGRRQHAEKQSDGAYHVTIDGHDYLWSFPDADTVVITASDVAAGEGIIASQEPGASPDVTCVTTTPEPSDSASPVVSPSAKVRRPSESPTPSASDEVAGSPFQCGFEFASDEFGTDALRIFGSATTDSAIRNVFEQWYGEQAPTTEVPDSGALAYHASVEYDVTGYAAGVLDPARVVESDKAFGIAFVAVSDGVVVGTISPESDGATYGMVEDRDGLDGPAEGFMWDLGALSPCGVASVDGADIYAIAGAKDGDVVEYSWVKVSE